MATRKKEETTEATEGQEQVAIAVVIGSCAVKHNGVIYTNGKEFELSEDELKLQGIKYLFGNQHLMFKDDLARTREYIENFRDKRSDKDAGKTVDELEKGAEYK